MQEQYADQNFTVLGFPCNQFGAQEPGSNEEILEFAQSKYDVNFPMFAKIEVNGSNACELYNYLKAAKAGDDGNADIGWNFTKFLVGKDGHVIKRYAPQDAPQKLSKDIEAALG